jgi:ubiquinone/menaquinone biosynthesis C-methylase UbiE
MSEQAYIGAELPIFAKAVHWKRYVARLLRPYLKGNVLEVGAGLGANTTVFCGSETSRWLCLEPDASLAALLHNRFPSTPPLEVRCGTTADLRPEAETYDAVLYCDVLEHIQDDRAELERAARLLRPGGALIVVAPAHMILFSDFDAAIGHFRRYTKSTLAAIAPPGASLRTLRYLDAAGLVASAGNRLFLRQSRPTVRQVLFWDRCLVPVSRMLDPMLLYSLGKSLLAVWTKDG